MHNEINLFGAKQPIFGQRVRVSLETEGIEIVGNVKLGQDFNPTKEYTSEDGDVIQVIFDRRANGFTWKELRQNPNCFERTDGAWIVKAFQYELKAI